ncbi:HutD family protein [Caballeronia sp. LZ035]|uniref:HutD/Ves family protein n=1 Tax=Caballeronia sp. LZ035 TaxID=3038568 RepID=UPI002860959C|nr:HutD family protein [Caballeronia sp. LZ035]MDR5762122.1 HutD family protein [Caballeronia sp. LZ035]
MIRAASLVPQPWKNGGGMTREIATGPKGASLDGFAWRLSLADVALEGAFSSFAGVDRVLVLLDGAGMRLAEAGGAMHVLDRPLALARFAGETAIHATLINGPTRDFNVMVRRDLARATVEARRGAHAIPCTLDVTFVFCVSGQIEIELADGARLTLHAGDTLRLDQPAACSAEDDAGWLHVGIELNRDCVTVG